MRATIDAKTFFEVLSRANNCPYGSKHISVLDGIYIRFGGGRCILAATNLESWLVTESPAEGDTFAFVLPRPTAVAKACRCFDGELVLEYTEGSKSARSARIALRCGSRSAEMEAMLCGDYPDLPEAVTGDEFSANAGALLKRVEQVRYAAKRPAAGLSYACMSIQLSGRHIFALDGHRMAWDGADEPIVPRPFMVRADFLAGLQIFGNAQVTFRMGGNRLQITDGTTSLFCPIPSERVYDFESAVPKQYAEEFHVQPQHFLRELTYLEQFVPNAQSVTVQMCNGVLSMSAGAGLYHTKVDISGDNSIPVAFNLRYMKDALKQFRREEWVTVQLGGVISPIVLTAEKRSDRAMVLQVRRRSAVAAA